MLKSLLQESRRSRSVRRLDRLDGSAGGSTDGALDRFAERAALAFDAPVAFVSVIHGDSQHLKAGYGLVPRRMPRRDSFCTHVVDGTDILECRDPASDARFADLPSVTGPPGVRYYIGAPLRLTTGIGVGALCVVDVVPREAASPDQRAYLAGLARQAVRVMEAGAADRRIVAA